MFSFKPKGRRSDRRQMLSWFVSGRHRERSRTPEQGKGSPALGSETATLDSWVDAAEEAEPAVRSKTMYMQSGQHSTPSLVVAEQPEPASILQAERRMSAPGLRPALRITTPPAADSRHATLSRCQSQRRHLRRRTPYPVLDENVLDLDRVNTRLSTDDHTVRGPVMWPVMNART